MIGRLFIFLKISITAALLVYVVSRVNVSELWHHLIQTSPTYLIVALSCAVLQVLIVGARWSVIIRDLDKERSHALNQWKIQQVNWTSQAIAHVLPFLASDVSRVMMLREFGIPTKLAVESALIDRGIALVTLIVIAGTGMSFSHLFWATGPYAIKLISLVSLSLIATVLGLAIAPPLTRLLRDVHGLRTLCDATMGLRRLLIDKKTGQRLLLLAATVHVLSISIFWLLARGNGVNLTPSDAMAIAPLLVLVTMIPIALGGWGVREIFLIALLGKAGVAPETSLILALLFGAAGLIAAAPGFLLAIIPSRVPTQAIAVEDTGQELRVNI